MNYRTERINLINAGSVLPKSTLISSDGTIDRDLSARIQKATGAYNYNQLSNIWKNRNIQTNTKIRIYVSAVLTFFFIMGARRGTLRKSKYTALRFFINAA